MKTMTASVLAAALLWNNPVMAQDASDDWDYGEDPAEKTSIAAVTFETFGVAVRCRDKSLSVIVSGLPVASGERKLRYRMDAIEEAESVWVSGRNSPTAFALWPRRIADDFSRGGTLALAAMDGDQVRRYQVDLPSSNAAIPRVLQACGLESDSQDDAPGGETLSGLRWVRPLDITFPSNSRYESGLAAIQCQIRSDGRLRDCEIESEFPEGSGFGRAATLGAHRTGQVAPSGVGQARLEDRRVAFVTRYNSYEALLAPPPSRLPDREGANERLNGLETAD